MYTTSEKILTIGTFDGVHIGHQKIISQVVKIAKENNQIPSVLTLFPHPRMVLKNKDSVKLLNTINERIALLKQFGIEAIVVKAFSKDFANLSPRDYVEGILIKELNTKQVVIGYDHHFGKNRSANINDLKKFAKTFNFEVHEITAQDIEDVTVSSTKIREALHQGHIIKANSFLGYNYFLTGTVIKGKGLGKTIDFPTANITIETPYKLIPKNGVYVVKSEINDTVIYGMMNIGTNPTVNGKSQSIEVHFFQFNQNLYDKSLQIELLQRLRSEKKFKNLNALKSQLKNDRVCALAAIKILNV